MVGGVGDRVTIMDYDYGGGAFEKVSKVNKEVIARVKTAIIQAQFVLSICWSTFYTQPSPLMIYKILIWPVTYVFLPDLSF